jgi:hypothetical protein
VTDLLPAEDYKIDVLWLAREAVRTLLDHWRLAVALGWAPLALVLAADVVAAVLGGRTVAGILLVGMVRGLGMIAFGSIFIVRWHRFVLRNETGPGELFSPAWRIFLTAAMKLALLMLGGMLIIALILGLLPIVVAAPLAFIGFIALLAASVRVGLVFPAAAIERPITFRASWDRLAGNGLRLFACAFLCYVPFLILRLLVDQVGMVSPTLIWIVLACLSAAITLAGASAIATVLSDVSRNVTASKSGVEP